MIKLLIFSIKDEEIAIILGGNDLVQSEGLLRSVYHRYVWQVATYTTDDYAFCFSN